MRRCLTTSTLAAVAAAVVLLGLPLAVAFGTIVTNRALDQLESQARSIQVTLNRLAGLDERADALAAQADQGRLRLILVDGVRDGAVLIDTGGTRPRPPLVDRLLRAGEAERVRGDGLLAVALPIQAGGVRQLLVAVQDDAALQAEVRTTRLGIALLAIVSLGVAAVAALWQGRLLAAPLEHLAVSARRLGEGDFSARAPRSGLPEPDEVARALDTTATRLGAMLDRSRSFGADASHQLRTPLTALRLDLEALEGRVDEPALLDAAMAETDRLEETIRELLALSEAPPADERVDVVQLAAARVEAVRPVAAAQGRQVTLDAVPVPAVRARAAALGQSLQVLLDNALQHGAGDVTVYVHEVTGGVRVCVGDQGPGIPPDREADLLDHAPGTADRNGHGGRGLPLARSLVEAEGGRITLERARPGAVLCLLLPTTLLPAPAAARSAVTVPPARPALPARSDDPS